MPFQKGQSGNPSGRAKGEAMGTVLRRMLAEKPPDGDGRRKSEQIACWVINQALTAEKVEDRWHAVDWIWRKVDGPDETRIDAADGVTRLRIDRFIAEIPPGAVGHGSSNGHIDGTARILPEGSAGTLDGQEG